MGVRSGRMGVEDPPTCIPELSLSRSFASDGAICSRERSSFSGIRRCLGLHVSSHRHNTCLITLSNCISMKQMICQMGRAAWFMVLGMGVRAVGWLRGGLGSLVDFVAPPL